LGEEGPNSALQVDTAKGGKRSYFALTSEKIACPARKKEPVGVRGNRKGFSSRWNPGGHLKFHAYGRAIRGSGRGNLKSPSGAEIMGDPRRKNFKHESFGPNSNDKTRGIDAHKEVPFSSIEGGLA